MVEQTWKIGDCLKLLPEIPDKSIDMVLCDLPYGITKCSWDSIIPLKPLWEQYKRIIKDNGAIVLTSRQPFTSVLLLSNLKMFRYELIWEKDKGTDFGNSNKKPLNAHENVLIFYKKLPTYNKQMKKGKPYVKKNKRNNYLHDITFSSNNEGLWINKGKRTPTTVIKIARDSIHKGKSIHPTQKPVALFEYLIKTYTNEGDTVHDSCLGSGTTLEACMNLNRNCIGFDISDEWEPHYVKRTKQNCNLKKFFR